MALTGVLGGCEFRDLFLWKKVDEMGGVSLMLFSSVFFLVSVRFFIGIVHDSIFWLELVEIGGYLCESGGILLSF